VLNNKPAAEAVHDGDDCERNTSDDQSIFDCRRARLVSLESPSQCDYAWTL
jgi:hypothetical protein